MTSLPRICPCTKKVSQETFFIFILFLDILTQGLGGLICGGIGLIIYCYKKNFNSFYFKIFSYGRLFIDIVIMFFIIILIFRFFGGKNDFENYIKNYINVIFFFIFLICYYLWNIYLSYNFVEQVKIYQNEFYEEKSEEEILLQDSSNFSEKDKEVFYN